MVKEGSVYKMVRATRETLKTEAFRCENSV